ncbi:acyl-CoA thioesterase [Amycolatopsis nigrescens]|uniref:acyl-CoA thioesterase n=1 Tax=Amycolatopsis nigrescens TaxID=381445 RepID=UPI00036C803B|nr:thioesterase family protein [Amycolatopsis nigrescens]
MTENAAVRMPLRVRYHECDGQGIVFNANYLAYVDMATFDLSKELFGTHAKLLETGFDMVVAESNVRYLAGCHFDDELMVNGYLTHLGRTSMIFDFEIRRGEELVTEVKNRYVWVRTDTLRPAPPPDHVREIFAARLTRS